MQNKNAKQKTDVYELKTTITTNLVATKFGFVFPNHFFGGNGGSLTVFTTWLNWDDMTKIKD